MHEEVLRELSTFAARVDIDAVPGVVTAALRQTLLDSFGVAIAGANTPEVRRLAEQWVLGSGRSSRWGAPGAIGLEAAIMLNGIALCSLELDEGNKYARGHPGAHVLPAALAEAERLDSGGPAFLSAVLAGYEVAARIARGFSPREGLHPHGNWGAIGAAVAVGRLNGFAAEQLAEAMDAAAGLVLASPFASAVEGSFVRNTWVGAAGVNGVTAVRIVQAGLGSVDATGTESLGRLLGSVDPAAIVSGLGERWEIAGGYFKRHSSCNYTHPPADAAIAIRGRHAPAVADIAGIEVATHALAAPLNAARPRSRLAAMFSIPHVVAVAIIAGECLPESFSPDRLGDAVVDELRQRVRVVLDAEIDARRPAERGARVTVELTTGERLVEQVPNPIGDADYHPFTPAETLAKLAGLIGDRRAKSVRAGVDAIWNSKTLRDATGFLR